MAFGVKIPIVSEFTSKNFKQFLGEFKKAEGAAAKFKLAWSKAMTPAGLTAIGGALTAVGYAAFDMAKAAAEDSRQQAILAKTLQNVTNASDSTIASTEKLITSMQMATGVSDTQLREGLGNLVRATQDLTRAQDLLALSLDISKATGKDLSSVTIALGKAANGSISSLKRLGIPLDENAVKAKDFNRIVEQLGATFGGAAAANAETLAGKMDILNQRWGEAKEKLGAQLTPALTDLVVLLSDLVGLLDKVGGAFNWAGAQIDYTGKQFSDAISLFPGVSKSISQVKADLYAQAEAAQTAAFQNKLLRHEFIGLWDAINYGKQPLSWLVTSGIPNLNSVLEAAGLDTKIVAKETSGLGGSFQEATTDAQRFAAAVKGAQEALQGVLTGYLDVTEAAKGKGVGGFVQGISGQATQIKNLAKNLTTLQGKGLSPQALQGIMSLDLGTAASLAQDLVNSAFSARYISSLNKSYATVQGVATQFGQQMAVPMMTGAPVTQHITITNPNPQAVVKAIREYGRNAGPIPIAVTGSF